MIYIPFIYFSILFLLVWKKYGAINVGHIILLFYLLSSFFSIVMYQLNMDVDIHVKDVNYDILPTFLYCGLLTLSMSPFFKYNSQDIREITLLPNKKKIIVWAGWILVTLNMINLAMSYEDIILSLNEDMGDLRTAFYRDENTYANTKFSLPIVSYFIFNAPCFSPLMLLLSFYGMIYMKEKWVLNTLLLLNSATLSILSIVTASRTQVIYWFMTFLVFFIFFRPLMSKVIMRKMKILFCFIGIFGLLYFARVTIERSLYYNDTSQSTLISYIGQPYIQFCHVYDKYTFNDITVDRTIPITSKYILQHKFNLTEYRDKQASRIHVPTGVFFTFLGDAMLDFGKIGMIIYVLFFYLMCQILLRRTSRFTISLAQLIIFTYLFRIPLLGLFAFVYKGVGDSLYLIGSLFIMYLISNRGYKRKYNQLYNYKQVIN